MRIAIGADHAGFEFKNEVVRRLVALGVQVDDLGAHVYDAHDDYPDFAKRVADAVAQKHADRGIVVCGSGVGACIAANKVKGVRAAVCVDTYSAHQGVEHDDMNVLVLGARIMGPAVAEEVVDAFLRAEFSGEERHIRRLNKVLAIEEDPS
jgi:ribose 5-phosphate isomerase B